MLYATPLACFRLADDGGLALLAVFPGVDARRDVLGASGAAIRLPPGGASAVEVLGPPLVGGSAAALRQLLQSELAAPPPAAGEATQPLTGALRTASRL